jgi:serine/threonine protein kinase
MTLFLISSYFVTLTCFAPLLGVQIDTREFVKLVILAYVPHYVVLFTILIAIEDDEDVIEYSLYYILTYLFLFIIVIISAFAASLQGGPVRILPGVPSSLGGFIVLLIFDLLSVVGVMAGAYSRAKFEELESRIKLKINEVKKRKEVMERARTERIGARTFLVIEGDKKLVKKCLKGLARDVLDDVLSGVNNWLLLREVEGVQRLSKFDVEEMCVFAEYVEGKNLKEYIAEKGGVLSEEEAVSLCLRIAKVLKRALDLGIVHRDLKPENVILSKKGEVVVVDWEFSAKLGTKPKALVGTIPYTPPEGREGLISKKYDVYSLGVMLHEMLTGKLPGTTLTLKNKDLEKLLERMIFLDPEKRAEIDEVITSLSQLCSTTSRSG